MTGKWVTPRTALEQHAHVDLDMRRLLDATRRAEAAQRRCDRQALFARFTANTRAMAGAFTTLASATRRLHDTLLEAATFTNDRKEPR